MTLMKRKRVGLGDAMSVVTKFVNACNRHDADAVFSCLHPDFDSIQPMFPTRNFRGADQVRRNWQAIFDAEPGFRLTVLRSAAVDDTVWLELHGAGQDAEVAGVFVMGIQGDRIRWARIYSGLVEPVPATAGDGSVQAGAAPQQQAPVPAGNGGVADEGLIAPVVDIEHSGRRHRRSFRRHGDGEGDGDGEVEVEGDEAQAEAGVPDEAEVTGADVASTEVAEPVPVPEEATAEPAPAAESESEPVVTEMIGAGESEAQVPVEPAEDERTVPPESPAEATAAHDMVTELEAEPPAAVTEAEAEAEPPPAVPGEPPTGDPPKRRFGRRR